jgi:hypothetical protein
MTEEKEASQFFPSLSAKQKKQVSFFRRSRRNKRSKSVFSVALGETKEAS